MASSSTAVPMQVDTMLSVEQGMPWVEKYRPKQLSDLIAHQEIIGTITRFIEEDRLPHLLLYGPPGTGKTSTILACARRMYGSNFGGMTLHLNASDDRGIDTVRNQIKDFASTQAVFSKGVKLIILDEADAMTNDSQMALRRVIEKYTKNARFCLICNYVSNISQAIQSRCTRFRFPPLSQDQMEIKLKEVIEEEKLNVSTEGIRAVLKLAVGDMRKALNVMQTCSMAFGNTVNEDAVYACTGQPHPGEIADVVKVLLNENYAKSYAALKNLSTDRGLALQDIIHEVHEVCMSLKLPNDALVFICKELADLEYRMSADSTEAIQMGALVSIMQLSRDIIAKAADSL